MAKKLTQAALSAAIKKLNDDKKCPAKCKNGKIGKAICAACGGTGNRK